MSIKRIGAGLLVIAMSIGGGAIAATQSSHHQQDLRGIERLHRQDSIATLSDNADQLAKLWDKDGVRFPAGRLAEIGASVIYADDKKWQTSIGRDTTLCYDFEVQDIQVAGDWAFEWGYGSLKSAQAGKTTIGYAKVMRVMKRQADGTWRFARVMAVRAPSAAGVVLKHPCR